MWVAMMAAPLARAHFVFVVPGPKGNDAQVIMSEDLQPDEDVDVAIIGGAKLSVKEAAGKQTPLQLVKGDRFYTAAIAGEGTRVVHGLADLGVKQRGDTKPFLLLYHPKTIIGDAFDPSTVLGKEVVAEIVPTGKAGALRFKFLIQEKPAAGVEINVVLPDGKSKKVETDARGLTPVFDQPGRYGAWARFFEPERGESSGVKYEEIRHYATLVADLPAAGTAAVAGATVAPVASADASWFAPLPEAASSFGAVACDGWMYVYGGHIVATHHYSTAAVSSRFHRLNLKDGKTWEELPGGPGVQGMNLAAYKGKIYRAGGMEPRNKPEEKADNYSIADVACFDPAKGKWEAMTPMPTPRSSHDVAVVDGKLYVLGGWNMRGRVAGTDWLDRMVLLDLNTPGAQWKTIKQPFERRAIIAAVSDGKIYMIGGFDEESDPSLRVEIYDTQTGKWSQGPNLPGKAMNGFAPAACTVDGKVYASVADGSMLRLNEAENRWDKIATTTPRIVHRLIPYGTQILVVGGAAKGKNLNLIEVVATK
jgi:N-acetylneuraminic acid mutarotase